MRHWVASIILGAFMVNASALSPLTPRFTEKTRIELLAGLTQAKLPEVAHNSVVIAITGALGFEAATGNISYHEKYEHLPSVEGHVTRVSEQCSRVEAYTWFPKESKTNAVVVEGTYCLVGPAEWASSEQWIGRRIPEQVRY